MAQCVWWLASIIGLEQELVSHIDRLQGPEDTTLRDELPQEVSATPRDFTKDRRVDQLLDCTEQYIGESKRLRGIAALKVSGRTATGRVNPSGKIKRSSGKSSGISRDVATNTQKDYSKTEGIDVDEISRRKAAGECLRCAWPSDRKGNHRVKNCISQIKLDVGTALSRRNRDHQKPVESSEGSDPQDSSDSEGSITADGSESKDNIN